MPQQHNETFPVKSEPRMVEELIRLNERYGYVQTDIHKILQILDGEAGDGRGLIVRMYAVEGKVALIEKKNEQESDELKEHKKDIKGNKWWSRAAVGAGITALVAGVVEWIIRGGLSR